MSRIHILLTFLLLSLNFNTYAQKKILYAKPTTEDIIIDGKTDEEVWKTAPIASDFVMYEPDNGKLISNSKKTDVKVVYDNTALYIFAQLNDDVPSKISKELTNRDVFGNSDVFSVSINGFNDGQQDYRFFVSAAGVQSDCIATEGSEDFSWDAIWFSKVKLTDKGWTVEIKIPYAAIRFSNAKKQTWGLNFMREIKRDFQKYTWNHIDTKIKTEITQEGILEGIENIKSPTRLFIIPYSSSYYQQDDRGSDKTFKAGLDIKYGINDAFTLDAILVPDFGQTKFDNAILNLEPFEQQFNENRPFFTESTDLFTKGNLFYSRRIGGSPIVDRYDLQYQLSTNEKITNFPSTVNLLNAVKISGRSENGLGIGFLNAVTEKTFAKIQNTDTNEIRNEIIQPLTNYNIFVLDKRFNQNSSVSFINTNTFRGGEFRDANVSAIVFDLNTKTNTYKLNGDFKYSAINDVEDYNGFKTSLGFAKTRGQFRYMFSGKYLSKNYDTNDLGILFVNNYKNTYAETSYRIVNPTTIFNTFRAAQNINIELENTTNKIQEAWYQFNINSSTLKNQSLNFTLQLNPIGKYDFYEPRLAKRFVFIPRSFYTYAGYTSNVNKAFNFFAELNYTKFDEHKRSVYKIDVGANYRFNDKLTIGYGQQYWFKSNDRGWVGFQNSDIIFAERNREIIQSDFELKYALTNKMVINLTSRYYWSYAENHDFFNLQEDGYLLSNSSYSLNKNRNFNSWNFDLSYSWWFAPGSELNFLYRNYATESTNIVEKNLKNNLYNVLNNNLTNILSISLRYYIDYNSLKPKH